MTVTTTSFETTDLDEAADLMASAYAGGRLRISAGDLDGLRLAQRRHDCGPAYLDTYTSNLPLDFHTHLDDVVMLTWMRDGGLDVDDQHHRFTVGRGDLFAVTAHRPYRAVTTSTTMTTVGIHLSLLNDLAAADPTTAVAAVERLEHQLVHPTRAQAWNTTVAAVTDYLTGPIRQLADQANSRLLVDSTNRILAAVMLTTLLPEPDTAPLDRADARSEAARRAVSFIESNPDTAITVTDIARAAHVTPPALRLAFRRHLDTTPTAYLRRVRLDQAHAQLTDATPEDGTTVSAVAGRWGFGNLTRFDQHYRDTYGEPPSTTLRR